MHFTWLCVTDTQSSIATGGVAPAAAPAGEPVVGAAAAPAAAAVQRGGILREIHALVVGFFTSLLPG